jgi:hypothetical protein
MAGKSGRLRQQCRITDEIGYVMPLTSSARASLGKAAKSGSVVTVSYASAVEVRSAAALLSRNSVVLG